jgi:hypothetical protein
MFLVQPDTIDQLFIAVKLLETYTHIEHTIEDINGKATLVVRKAALYDASDELKAKAEGDLAMAEMLFSGAFTQFSAIVCPMCAEDKLGSCGHLLFTTPKEVS